MASNVTNLYCRGFPPDFGESELIQLFSAHGTISSIRVVAGGEQGGTGTSAPHAFIKYEASEQASCPPAAPTAA